MAGWGSYYARSMDEELGTEYSPDLLTKKPILLSPYLLSVVAKASASIPAPTSACRWARTRRPSASS